MKVTTPNPNIASKLLARRQKQNIDYEISGENSIDEKNDEADFFDENEVSTIPPTQNSLYSSRASTLPKQKSSISSSIMSKSPSTSISSRSILNPNISRVSMAPNPTSNPTQTQQRATVRSTLKNVLANESSDTGAFSQSRTDELLSQFALSEKTKYLKKIQNDNDKLAELLKDVLDTKNLFLREVSWIQMNKDNLKNVSSKDTETAIASKLSNILDQSDIKGDDQLSKDIHQELGNFVTSVRAIQSDLNSLLITKLEEAEACLLNRDSKSTAVLLNSLKDFSQGGNASTRNLSALLSEKISKSIVTSIKDSNNIKNQDENYDNKKGLKNLSFSANEAKIFNTTPFSSNAQNENVNDYTALLRDKIREMVFKLISSNPISIEYPETLKKLLSEHISNCSCNRILKETTSIKDIVTETNLETLSFVRAIIYSEVTMSLALTQSRYNSNKPKQTQKSQPRPTMNKKNVSLNESVSSLLPQSATIKTEPPRYMSKRKSTVKDPVSFN